jgi:hypothetical protein
MGKCICSKEFHETYAIESRGDRTFGYFLCCKIGVCMAGRGEAVFAFFGPAPHLKGLEIFNPQSALNKDNPCGAGIAGRGGYFEWHLCNFDFTL